VLVDINLNQLNHLEKILKKYKFKKDDYKNSEFISNYGFYLPTSLSLKDDQIEYSNNNKTIKFNNICKGGTKTAYLVNASFVKTGIQSKTKVHKKSEQLDVN